jgi:hypothetical protein
MQAFWQGARRKKISAPQNLEVLFCEPLFKKWDHYTIYYEYVECSTMSRATTTTSRTRLLLVGLLLVQRVGAGVNPQSYEEGEQ